MNHLEQTSQWYNGFQNFIEGKDQFSPLLKVLNIDSQKLHDVQYARERHYHASMACFTQPGLAKLMIKAIDQYNHNQLGLPSFEKLFDPNVRKYCEDIDGRGFTYLPGIDPKIATTMREYFSQQKVLGENNELIDLKDFNHANVAEFPVDTILKCPHFLDIATDPEVLAIAERYLGTIPTVIVTAAWWSIAGREAPKHAQFYHYDYDDYKFCKLFLYLTDVDMDSGPHVYVPGTHHFDKVVETREKFAGEIERFDKFYISSLRKSDEDVQKYFQTDPAYFTGTSGSRFMVDTRGIHKGLLPKNRNRLILQITFGISPFFQQTIQSLPISQLPENDQSRLSKLPYKHVFRLFYSFDKSQPATTLVESPIQMNDDTVVLNQVENWTHIKMAQFYAKMIWSERDFKNEICKWLGKVKEPITSMFDLRRIMHEALRSPAQFELPLNSLQTHQAILDLQHYEKNAKHSMTAYLKTGKDNPDAIFWPNPTRPDGKSIYETLPLVKNHGIVNKETPIGSAGSCFAFEIAYNLQRRGFNYVVTERSHRPDEGIFCDGDETEYEKFSSAWGILFNTPSFRQIAEHSFGIKPLPKLLVQQQADGTTFYVDPFRENLFFLSQEAFEKDYKRHLEASKRALMNCKVFVLTLGLNECWQLANDEAVISRNPHSSGLSAILKHRTLTVQENIENIEAFLHTVRRYNPDFKLILTVSPIPFLATGRADECHVITANGHSKAVLRVAAEEVVRKNTGVYYLPSYELVMNCSKNAWEPDERHVTPETVSRVMELFDAMFVAKNNEN